MADLNIKNGWRYAAQELMGKVDPSGITFTASGFVELMKAGWIPTTHALADEVGLGAENVSTNSGWITAFEVINQRAEENNS